MIEERNKNLYLPDIIAFFLPQVGFIAYLLLFINFDPSSNRDWNLMIYLFWIILAIPGLISGLLTRNSTDGFETTFLSGIILFSILANGGLIIIQGFFFTYFIIFVISGIIIGFYTGCFGYMGGRIGKKAFSYSRPSEKKSPFDLLKRLFEKIISTRIKKSKE